MRSASARRQQGFRIERTRGSCALTLPAGTVLSEPVIIEKTPPSCVIVLRKASHAALFLRFSRREQRSLEVHLSEEASLSLVCLEEGASLTQRARIGRDARLHLTNVTLGNAAVDCVSCVEGAGGKSVINWVFRAQKKEKQELSMRSVYAAKSGGGDITVRGIAEEQGAVRVRGGIDIGKRAAGTQTYLSQHVLMLDSTAKVDAVPQLSIKTDDVKAGHAATVTNVSEEDLFYMTSRGVGREKARAMLVQGFIGDLLGRVAAEEIRKKLEAAVFRS